MLLFCSVYSIRKNPGAQAGPCPAAYTQNLGTRAVVYTQKSRSPGRALPSSVYAKFRHPSGSVYAKFRNPSGSVYAKTPEPGQGSAQQCIRKIQELGEAPAQRIRKNPGTRAGFCFAAYTV